MSETERNYFDMIDDTLRHRAERAERILGALLSGFERRKLLPEGREPLAEEVIEAVAQVFERLERAERILAALALAREAVVEASAAAYTKCKAENEWLFTHHIGIAFALLAALAAAEREVDG